VVVKQPKFTRVKEPTLLCNQVPPSTSHGRLPRLSGLEDYFRFADDSRTKLA
jgi:hypothetical protein